MHLPCTVYLSQASMESSLLSVAEIQEKIAMLVNKVFQTYHELETGVLFRGLWDRWFRDSSRVS